MVGPVDLPADLNRSRVDDVRLTAGIGVLEEDDVTRLEAVARGVAHGEVLVDLEPDGGPVRLGLYRQPRVGPAAETTLEDANIPVASLAEALNDPGAALLLGARAVGDDALHGIHAEVELPPVDFVGIEPDG